LGGLRGAALTGGYVAEASARAVLENLRLEGRTGIAGEMLLAEPRRARTRRCWTTPGEARGGLVAAVSVEEEKLD
jgi:hypothetical protein